MCPDTKDNPAARLYFMNFRGVERRDDRTKVRSARHVPESQEITLEVDRRISFSVGIRAWEEFISVASPTYFAREMGLNGPTDTAARDVCRLLNVVTLSY